MYTFTINNIEKWFIKNGLLKASVTNCMKIFIDSCCDSATAW